MKILVTGARGFVGRNLVSQLRNIRDGKARWYKVPDPQRIIVYEYDLDSTPEELDRYCSDADFVYNLAGVNRPENPEDFMKGNFGFASTLLDMLKKYRNTCPVMISSSIQAALDNPYGESKRAGEELMFKYSEETGAKVLVYRFSNLFGKWCRPNYNSVVATFCNNIAKGLPIKVNDPEVTLNLEYIDDVVDELIGALVGEEHTDGRYCHVPVHHSVKLGHIVELLEGFKRTRETLGVPDVGDAFTRKLHATYLSYLPEDGFSYPVTTHSDERGSFTELIRTADCGQVSVNITKPHVTKGNHWHHTKNEKFIVVSGRGVIRFRDVRDPHAQVIEYQVSGDKIEVIDVPAGYTHNFENLGDTDMVTLIWCNECFDPDRPDTYFEQV